MAQGQKLKRVAVSVVSLHLFLIVSIFMATLLHATTCNANALIYPDEPEYMRGDTAFIFGEGFEPNHQVIIEVTRADGSIVTGDGTNTPGSNTVTTDLYGNFTYAYIIDGGPDVAFEGTFNVRAIDAATMVELATTSFFDPLYLLQGCSREKGDCTQDDPSTGWADGTGPMNGWTSGNLKGWYELEDVPFRFRMNLRKPENAKTYYIMNEHDYLRSGIYGVDSASGFYVGAGPSVPGYTEGQLTKTCVFQSARLVGDNPTESNPCIVTGPIFTGIDDDGDGNTDEEFVDGIDNDGGW